MRRRKVHRNKKHIAFCRQDRLARDTFVNTLSRGRRKAGHPRKVNNLGIDRAKPHTARLAIHRPREGAVGLLLRGLREDQPNQVWCADITYLPMRRGFLYLVAIMDWHTRKVLAWRISNTLEAEFCVDALNEAIHKFGPPEIMNTDQGSQFTSFAWTDRLRRSGIRISMDGKGRFLDNIFVER